MSVGIRMQPYPAASIKNPCISPNMLGTTYIGVYGMRFLHVIIHT